MDAQQALVEGLHERGIVGDFPLKRFNVECMGAWHGWLYDALNAKWHKIYYSTLDRSVLNVDDIRAWYIEAWTAVGPGRYRVVVHMGLDGRAVGVSLDPVARWDLGEVAKS